MPDSANIFSWAATIPPTTDSLWRAQQLQRDRGLAVELDAHLGGAAGGEQGAGRADERLGGDAGDVDAGAADLVPLDHDDPPAGLGPVHRQRLPGLAAADHQQVDVLDVLSLIESSGLFLPATEATATCFHRLSALRRTPPVRLRKPAGWWSDRAGCGGC